jgi:uncharacterized membrane protein YdfJ with MMPL/SSD domain
MAVLALPVLDLRLAQVDARLLPEATQTRQLHDAVAVHFPELARPGPIVIVVDAPADSPEVADLSSRVAAVAHVSDVEATPAGSVTVLRAGLDQPAHSPAARRAVEAVRALGRTGRGRGHRRHRPCSSTTRTPSPTTSRPRSRSSPSAR